jgi:hypothetical protein
VSDRHFETIQTLKPSVRRLMSVRNTSTQPQLVRKQIAEFDKFTAPSTDRRPSTGSGWRGCPRQIHIPASSILHFGGSVNLEAGAGPGRRLGGLCQGPRNQGLTTSESEFHRIAVHCSPSESVRVLSPSLSPLRAAVRVPPSGPAAAAARARPAAPGPAVTVPGRVGSRPPAPIIMTRIPCQ